MKELRPIVQIEETIKKAQQYQYLGSFRPTIDGGKIFEYDSISGVLKPAEFKEPEFAGEGIILNTRPGCAYIEALNFKNAQKRLKKGKIFFHTIKF